MPFSKLHFSRAELVALLLACGVFACCFGPAPAPEDVYNAREFYSAFEPVLRAHVEGRTVELSAEQRASIAERAAAWPGVAQSMREDGDGFRAAEISTARLLSPLVLEALEGKPFDASLRELVLFKLETWAGRVHSSKGQ